jgi:glutathione synthase/RimK-type ligase-like ATP-grasp enzyme
VQYSLAVRVLLTDGSGLTSRQVATRLAADGHEVRALAPSWLALTRFTHTVRTVHRVPPYGADPWGWLQAALRIARRERIDVLFPTQEQVAILARAADRLTAAGITTAVPAFEALRRVQDKVSATRTLAQVDLPTPQTTIAKDPDKLDRIGTFPVYLKAPIGTASTSVARVEDAARLPAAVRRVASTEAFADGGVVVQQALRGPLVMVQSVFDHGGLVAWHANLRVREGAGGGAASKQSVELPEVREHLARLGAVLGWHGALSLDAILASDGVRYVDVNPRLVEPANALRAGTDLVGAMLALCRGAHPSAQPLGQPGVRTHQLLLAVLGAAERSAGRRGVANELLQAARHTGPYAQSAEELTPVRGDLLSSLPVAAACIATLIRPASYRVFSGGAVGAYALTPLAWRRIVAGKPDDH